MTTTPPAALRDVRRGQAADELVLVGPDGRSILLRGDGLTPDERVRMCAAALKILSAVITR